MKTSLICISCFCLAASMLAWSAVARNHSYIPSNGYVPDTVTATRIAEAVWIPIYGEKQIEVERPFTATLKDGVWTVEGTLPKQFDKGGVATAKISKQDGRILAVYHTK